MVEIKAGGVYKTRGGQKAFVLGWNPYDSTYVGYMEKYPGSYGWVKDGRSFHTVLYDLVEEWKEPRREKVLLATRGDYIYFVSTHGKILPDEKIIGSVWIEEGKWADPEDKEKYGT